MDTKRIETLLEAVRLGSYSKAAEELGYTRAAFVHMLKNVEEELGIPLLEKSHRGVALTEEGELIEPYLRRFLESEKELKRACDKIAHGKQKTIRIAAYPSIADSYLTDAVMTFRATHPEADLELHIYSGETVSEMIAAGRADLGIADVAHAEGCEWQPLFIDQMYLAMPIADWDKETPVVPLSSASAMRLILSEYAKKIVSEYDLALSEENAVATSANNGRSLLHLVESGMGVCFLSSLNAQFCPKDVVMLPTSPLITRTICVVYRDLEKLNALQKDALDFLVSYDWIGAG